MLPALIVYASRHRKKKKLVLTLLSSLSFSDIFVVLQPNNSLLNKLPSYSRNVRYKLRKNSACLFCTFSLLGEFQCITWKLRQYTCFFNTCFHCPSRRDGKQKKPALNYGGGLLISTFWNHCFALLLCTKYMQLGSHQWQLNFYSTRLDIQFLTQTLLSNTESPWDQ